MTQQEKVYKALDDLGIEYKVIHHQEVHTIEEMDALGIFTDGDFRRRVENDLSILNRPMEEVMTRNPIFIKKESLAVEILKILEKRKIDDLVVLEEDGCTVAGLVDIQDLPGFKLM